MESERSDFMALTQRLLPAIQSGCRRRSIVPIWAFSHQLDCLNIAGVDIESF